MDCYCLGFGFCFDVCCGVRVGCFWFDLEVAFMACEFDFEVYFLTLCFCDFV